MKKELNAKGQILNSPKSKKNRAGRVLLHFGADKTGSTAIQNMLYENRQGLPKSGLFYHDPRLLHNTIQSGNGQELYLRLREGATSFEVKEILSNLIEFGKLSIISCEGFSDLSKENLNTLFESLDQLDIEFKILMYIRNPVDYYMSAYSQAVKRHGYAKDFQGYIDESFWTHASKLAEIADSHKNPEMTVILFDQRKNDLVKSFWESVQSLFNLNVPNIFYESEKVVNRSLFQEEIAFLVMINERFGSKFSSRISDYMLNVSDFVGTALSINQTQIKKIAKRHSNDVNNVNNRFFGGEQVVTFDASKNKGPKPRSLKNYPNVEFLTQLLLYFMRNFETIVETTGSEDIENLRKHLLLGEYFSAMPDGQLFDNIFYLLNNVDIARSNNSPLFHFLNWGKNENRKWRSKHEE
jgi:hypothetical protein